MMFEYATHSEDSVSFDQAWLYCATCTHNDKYDWRLPTHQEWIMNDIPYYVWFDDRFAVAAEVYNVIPVRGYEW